MEASELRLGNLIERNGVEITIGCGTITALSDGAKIGEPIPITENWLLKFGFESNGDEHEEEFYHKKHECFGVKFTSFEENGIAHIWDGSFTGAPIKYVHQLQNLVYALTGEELTIK